MDKKYQKCILTNMCMVYKNEMILVVNRKKSDWPGISFPGGHVESNETILESVIREMKEETNLDIKNPKLCGIYEWKREETNRYIGFLYKTDEFEGKLKSNEEGELFRINKHDLNKYELSQDFDELFEIMDKN